jgi:hypothetical protein
MANETVLREESVNLNTVRVFTTDETPRLVATVYRMNTGNDLYYKILFEGPSQDRQTVFRNKQAARFYVMAMHLEDMTNALHR